MRQYVRRPLKKAAEPTILEEWGLGREESGYVSLNRDYDWYVDQYETKSGHQYNDGPASIIYTQIHN